MYGNRILLIRQLHCLNIFGIRTNVGHINELNIQRNQEKLIAVEKA